MRALVILASLIFNLLFTGLVIADEFTALEGRIDSQLLNTAYTEWDPAKIKAIKELIETKLAIENLRIARINIQISDPRAVNAYNRMKATAAEEEVAKAEARKRAEAAAAKYKTEREARIKAGLEVKRAGTQEAKDDFKQPK